MHTFRSFLWDQEFCRVTVNGQKNQILVLTKSFSGQTGKIRPKDYLSLYWSSHKSLEKFGVKNELFVF